MIPHTINVLCCHPTPTHPYVNLLWTDEVDVPEAIKNVNEVLPICALVGASSNAVLGATIEGKVRLNSFLYSIPGKDNNLDETSAGYHSLSSNVPRAHHASAS